MYLEVSPASNVPVLEPLSDPENEFVVPFSIGEDGDTIRYTNVDERSGWYHGAEPGLWNWEMAEDFDDYNGNGVWDPGEYFTDSDGDNQWDGPELIKKLETTFKKWSPAIFVGYNSINFDEEFIRKTFFKTLFEPYLTQFNGNKRADVIGMTRASKFYFPDCLKVGINEKGNQVFKLDVLTELNNIFHNAHDAMGDVEALVFLLEKIRSGAPSLYDQLIANNNKHHVKNLLTSFKPVEITLRFGPSVPKTYVGCFCGSENGNPNRIGFFDLNQDDSFNLINGSQKDIEDALNGSLKRIRTLAINKADTFTVCEQADALHNSLCTAIQRNEAFRAKVSQAMAERYSDDDHDKKLVEEKIYDGFVSSADEERLIKLQSATLLERQDLVLGM